MTTSLKFTAPIDLSVGKVSITDGSGSKIREWIATPDNRLLNEQVEPGFYTAEISPAGVAPQSVVFEVHADQHNEVTAPSFSSLIASSGNTTFLDSSSIARAIDALYSNKAEQPDLSLVVAAPGLLGADDDGGSKSTATLVSSAEEIRITPRRFSVGLSVEDPSGAGALRPFAGRATMELSEVRLELVASGPKEWSPYAGERVHLSVAIEGLRTERLLLPMYRGGTLITVTPSTMSSNDVELEVLPNDSRLRALARALIAGTPGDAEAVRTLVRSPDDFLSADAVIDPWEAILSALLSIRFPDTLPGLNVDLAEGLVKLTPWAHDSYVIQARQHLYSATEAGRAKAADDALKMLGAALGCGWPYFSYAKQLFAEMIEVLQRYFDKPQAEAQRDGVAAIRDRWLRDQPLQAKAGASFSWRSPDPTPSTRSASPVDRESGGLGEGTLLVAGQIIGSNIRLDPVQAAQPAKESSAPAPFSPIEFGDAPSDCPALKRDAGPENDPNLGRFGGQNSLGGYTLRTTFDGDPEGDVTTITMTVESDQGACVPPEAIAWFCLHPTYRPQWVKVHFGNGRAVCSVQSWGGFTAGVWVPWANIELESDLSKLPYAPRIVRER